MEAVFGHELQLLLMSASLKCPTYLRQSFTKSSVLMRWNDTENLYLDVKSSKIISCSVTDSRTRKRRERKSSNSW